MASEGAVPRCLVFAAAKRHSAAKILYRLKYSDRLENLTTLTLEEPDCCTRLLLHVRVLKETPAAHDKHRGHGGRLERKYRSAGVSDRRERLSGGTIQTECQGIEIMRRLVLKMSMSLDGFVAGPNGEIDWMIRSRDEGAKAWIADTLWQAGLHAMGSRTYYVMAGYWPTSTDLLAAPMNDIPKVIFTRQRSLDLAAGHSTTAPRDSNRAFEAAGGKPAVPASPNAASWAEAQIANGDLATEIERLKQQPGKDIVAHGGAGFAQSIARLGLIDEYRLVVHPAALGVGLPLFAELPKPVDLKLVSTSIFGSGAAAHVYRPA